MRFRTINWVASAALILAQSATPASAQTSPLPPTAATHGGPQIQPPRPQPEPPTRPGRPQIQPPRPVQPQPPVPPGGPQIQPPRPSVHGFARIVRCESRSSRYQTCRIPRTDRVQLVRVVAGACVQNRSWGRNGDRIWVSRNCRGDFGYGYGSVGYPQPQPVPNNSRRPSTGTVIAGVLVAGGLIALLASKGGGRSGNGSTEFAAYPAGPPADLSADLSGLPNAARASVQTCLFDAARQIGVTGGSRLSYDRQLSLEPGSGDWRLQAAVTATYPDGNRALVLDCQATSDRVVHLDFS